MRVEELRGTAERMEERLQPAVPELFTAYERLARRFHADLRDERDELLARSEALMLVQELVQELVQDQSAARRDVLRQK